MQPYGLTVDKFLDHAAKWHPDAQVAHVDAAGETTRIGYASLRSRSNRMSGALRALGLRFGDRIGTLAWNTQQHVELYYAAMGAGFVCHTLNPRLTTNHLAAMVNEAQDRIIAVSADLLPVMDELLPFCPVVEHVIVMDGIEPSSTTLAGFDVGLWQHDALLDARGAALAWGDFDENAAAGLCYTSGTTGRPKGVLYTHRSNYLHTTRALQADSIGLTAKDVVLLAVPMFHANAWGLPFAAPAVGAKLVLPGRLMDGESLSRLMREERVTIAIGVQTVWVGVIDHLEAYGGELPALQRVLIGGSSCPEGLIRRMEETLGARVQTSWGMTELSPMGTIAAPDDADGSRASGRPPMGLDLKLTDADGVTLSTQRGVVGHLKVKGPSVIERYFDAEASVLDDEGYLDTGDLASIDEAGNLTIAGRAKDLIKSGGEWINPTEIEALVGQDPSVGLVAVIGRPDAKWGERPVLVVEPRQGHLIDLPRLVHDLRGKIADWWLPDRVVRISPMPLAASGKIDKMRLRAAYADGELVEEKVSR